MQRMTLPTLATLAVTTIAPLALHAQEAAFEANVANAEGTALGTVALTPTASGQMLVTIDLEALPQGRHAVHIHETGDCGDGFEAAGGHLADGMAHGVMDAGGPHPGDLPNTVTASDGTMQAEYFVPTLTEALVNDAAGSAFIVHSGTDDYTSQPAGDAGQMIACGVFEPAGD